MAGNFEEFPRSTQAWKVSKYNQTHFKQSSTALLFKTDVRVLIRIGLTLMIPAWLAGSDTYFATIRN